ncbi:hypothetical protein BU17DRAFT_98988 [Hysterangium stoloniferum]|nr:hypothetical protein BU17DRAFT_98988 [Hysterangium stoloniferum]
MSGQTALILGATGATGKHLLRELLGSPHFTRVGEFGRRTTPLDAEGMVNPEKLVQKTMDLAKPEEAGLKDEKWDVIFIALGTTRKRAGGIENFRKIDQEYVVKAAETAKNSSIKQRLIYISYANADSSSSIPYAKSKGETEGRLAALGYDDTILFRPGVLLDTNRTDGEVLERAFQWVVRPFTALSNKLAIPVADLAKAVRITGILGSSGLPPPAEAIIEEKGGAKYTVIGNAGAINLAKQ